MATTLPAQTGSGHDPPSRRAAAPGAAAALTRASLRARRTAVLAGGRPAKADVWVARLDDGTRVVVKEFAGRSWPLRVWGWALTRREARCLERLVGVPFVPRLVGRLGGTALVMSHVDCTPLTRLPAGRRPAAVSRLAAAVERVHEEGLVHLDLRARDNVAVTPGGDVVLFDWAAAVRIPRWLPRRTGPAALLRLVDRSALVKWKLLLAPETVTPEERELARRFRPLRRLWPFNRKGVGSISPPAPPPRPRSGAAESAGPLQST